MAKMTREQAVRERRARKQEKKEERKQAAAALSAETESTPEALTVADEAPSE